MKVRLFDVCVFGRGIGGLVAALMLQRRGTKLLVLSRRNGGPDPAMSEFLCGFTLKPLLKRVGFHPTEVNAIPSLEAPLQLVFPTGRIDCHGDEAKFSRELARELPRHAEQILQLFKESYGHLEIYQHLFNSRNPFPPKGFFAKREFSKLLPQICDVRLLEDRALSEELKSFDVGEEFERTVEAMELALTALVSRWTSGAHLAHLLTLARWEGFSTPMGTVDLRKMLIQKINERGGAVVECNEFSELEFDRNRISGVQIKGAEWDEVRWQVAVVGGDPRGIIAMVPHGSRFRKWRQSLEAMPIHARKAFQAYRLRPEGLPLGMRQQGLLIPARREDAAERRTRVRALRYAIRWDEKEGNPEVYLALTAFLPPGGYRPDAKQLAAEIRREVNAVLPFLEHHLIEEPADPLIPTPEGEPGVFHHGFVYTAERAPMLGICGILPETPFKNVFQAGDMIFPGLGLDGEILAGIQASHSVAAALAV